MHRPALIAILAAALALAHAATAPPQSRLDLEARAAAEPSLLRAVQSVTGAQLTCYGTVLQDVHTRCDRIDDGMTWVALGARLYHCDQRRLGRRNIPWCPVADEAGLQDCLQGLGDELVQVLKGNAMTLCGVLEAEKAKAELFDALAQAASEVRLKMHAALADLADRIEDARRQVVVELAADVGAVATEVAALQARVRAVDDTVARLTDLASKHFTLAYWYDLAVAFRLRLAVAVAALALYYVFGFLAGARALRRAAAAAAASKAEPAPAPKRRAPPSRNTSFGRA